MSTISKQSLPRGERGSALLAALCLAVVLTISLASYLALCFTSLAMSTRSVMASHSLEIAEAGVEQAIYASNTGTITGWDVNTAAGTTTMSTTMTMTSSGLVPTTSNPTPFDFGNGATGVVNITMTYTAGFPQAIQSITSQGVITLPFGSIASAATPVISRTLTYTGPGPGLTDAAPVFVNAVAATSGKITFNGGGTVDSYNSNPSAANLQNGSVCVIASVGTTPWAAIGGPTTPIVGSSFTASGSGTGTGTAYEDYNGTLLSPGIYINKGYSAILASQDVSSATTNPANVSITSAIVQGYVVGYDYNYPSSTNWFSSLPNSGKLIGPNSSVGTYIDPSRIVTTPVPYQPVVPESLPANSSNYTGQTSLGTAGAASPTVYVAGVGITLGNGQSINIVGPVVIISYGNLSISGTGGIYLTTASASLQIFEEYGNIAIGGNGIQNQNSIGSTGIPPLPKRVALLSTNNSFSTATISTTQPFYGVIYFPYMPVTVSSNATILGSIVGSSVSFTGSSTIHYDLALRQPDTTVGDAAFANLTAPISVNNLVASVP